MACRSVLRFLAGMALLALAGSGLAQTYVQLILDASGSMYNQLDDGRYRLVAAKSVLTDFVTNLPEDGDLHVGLRIYGSELQALDPGSCTDSRLFVPMAGVDRAALLGTIDGVLAKGATPIAWSLEQAGSDFTEPGSYMIVLVTDGEESCGGDIGSVMNDIEARGIDVDLRIIGFDLSESAAKTFEGVGKFENARSTEELAAALGRAVEDVTAPREARTYQVTVNVTRAGEPADDGVRVTFESDVTGEATVLSAVAAGQLQAQLPAGAYTATVADAFSQEPLTIAGLTVLPDEVNAYTFELAMEHDVTLSVTPVPAAIGSVVSVQWSGAPANDRNWVTIVRSDAPENAYARFEYARTESGSVELTLGGDEGEFEARFHLDLPEGGSRVIGRSAPFVTHRPEVALTAPDEVIAGSMFDVSWAGPGGPGDYITIVPALSPPGTYQNYEYTRRGNPLSLLAPVEPGDYELRYMSDATGPLVMASRPISLTLAEYALQAAESAAAASMVQIHWTGPAHDGDYITVVPAGASEGSYTNYEYVQTENPITLRMPPEAGEYELRYVTDQDGSTLASQPIAITEAEVALQAPAAVPAGLPFVVTWSGPDGQSDYITIVPAGAAAGAYLDYAYTTDGSPVLINAPEEPGDYEVRYVAGDSNATLSHVAVRVD